MATFVSPGIYVVEKDISEYPATVNSSVVGLVGFASKGPANKATLITSQQQLVDTFGKPFEALYGQGLEGALEILEATDQVYFVRATDANTAADASAQVAFGGCPTVIVSAGAGKGDRGIGDNPPGYTSKHSIEAVATSGDWGITRPLTLRVNVYDGNGVKKTLGDGRVVTAASGTVDITSASASVPTALRKAIGAYNDNSHFGVYASSFEYDASTAMIVGHYAGSGSYMTVEACSGTSFNATKGVHCLLGMNASGSPSSFVSGVTRYYEDPSSLTSSIKVWGSEFRRTGANSISYRAESIHPGDGYDAGTTLAGDTSGNSVEITPLGGTHVGLQVNQDGAAIETFKVGYVSGATFIETAIQEGEVDLTSDIIKGNTISGVETDLNPTGGTDFSDKFSTLVGLKVRDTNITGDHRVTIRTTGHPAGSVGDTTYHHTAVTDMDPRNVKLVQGTYNMAGGNNGIPSSDNDKATAIIGDATVTPKTGMQALDDDLLNISVALVPGVSLQEVQNNLISLAETTQNFLAVVSPPYAVGTTQDAVDWHNGLNIARTATINNSYAAIYWPWVQMFSVFDRKDIWLDPSIYGVRQMAYTDRVGEAWFAPAGYQRGRLTKPTDVEVRLNRGDLNTLYSGGNAINPIVNFPQQGVTVWGQRTTQRDPTALDRINIRRLMIVIRKTLLLSTRRFVFEPNDEFLWAQIENVVSPLLDDISNRRGITEFRVVCDKTTNTPVRIDRNELWCKVLIKPTKTAEMLVFELNLTNQSADLGKL